MGRPWAERARRADNGGPAPFDGPLFAWRTFFFFFFFFVFPPPPPPPFFFSPPPPPVVSKPRGLGEGGGITEWGGAGRFVETACFPMRKPLEPHRTLQVSAARVNLTFEAQPFSWLKSLLP